MLFIFLYFFPFIKSENTDNSNEDFRSNIWFIQDPEKHKICDLSLSQILINSEYLFCNNTKIQLNSQSDSNPYEIKIKGTTNLNQVIVNNTKVNIILDDAKIASTKSFAVISSTLYLFILGESNFISSFEDAGILCDDSYIQIMNATSQDKIKNTITLSSTKYAAIGGGASNQRCKGLFFYGGTIIAAGGEFGAGIGGGQGTLIPNSAGVNRIEIHEGNIKATGGKFGAGIGGGFGNSEYSSSIRKISIYGGTIHTTGGEYSAGIGGGYGYSKSSSSITESIEIRGGDITSIGGNYGSGIGNGYSYTSDSSLVASIILDASTVINNTIDNSIVCTSISAKKGTNASKCIGQGHNPYIVQPTVIERGGSVSNVDSSTCTFQTQTSQCLKPWSCSNNELQNCPKCNLQNCDYSSIMCTCERCREGYKIKDGVCVSKQDCQNQIDECYDYAQGDCAKCEKCRPGYFLEQGKCNACLSNNDKLCVQFKDQCQCQQCQNGYSPNSQNQYKCEKCQDPFCQVCSQTNSTICTQCIDSYSSINNRCEKCNVVCQSYQKNSCNCQTCKEGYRYENGKCNKCNINHCSYCAESVDKCSQCQRGFKSNSNQICEDCNVLNCLNYSYGCYCSICALGYEVSNGKCIESKFPQNNFIGFVVDSSNQIQSNWINIHKNKLKTFVQNKTRSSSISNADKYGFNLLLTRIDRSNEIQSLDINNLMNAPIQHDHIFILQFDSLDNGLEYDFNQIQVNALSIEIYCLGEYLQKTNSIVSIKSSKYQNIESLSIFFGSINSNKIELNSLSLIASTIHNEMLSIFSNCLFIDCNHLGLRNSMSIETNEFGVIIPELYTSYTRNSISFGMKTIHVNITRSNNIVSSFSIPANIGQKQIKIVSSIRNIAFTMNSAESIKAVSYFPNITIENDLVNKLSNDNVTIYFDNKVDWDKLNLVNGIAIHSNLLNTNVNVESKPKNIKLLISQAKSEILTTVNPIIRNSGLSDRAVFFLIFSFIIASAMLIINSIYFFRKPVPKGNPRDSNTPLLNQVYIDGF